MLAGAYSQQYRNVEQQHVEHLKELEDHEKSDVVARAKKLSNETNKRRRASAVKRKNEVQKEEKRRQNILFRRREKQREATEKYQRAHLPTRPSSNYGYKGNTSPTHGIGVLEQALRIVRGASPSSPHRSSAAALEHCVGYSSNKSYQKYPSEALIRPYNNRYNSPQRPQSPADRIKDYSRSVAVRNELHNKSLRNLSNSRSLFEQQLQQHQQKMIEQQKQSLWDFNTAVMKEIQNDGNVQGIGADENSSHSASLSSLDSLEETNISLQSSFNSSHQDESKKAVPSSLLSGFQVKPPHTEVVKGQVLQMNNDYSQIHALPPKPPQNKNTSITMPESLKTGSIYRTNRGDRVVVQGKSTSAPVNSDDDITAPTQPSIDVTQGNTRPKVQKAWTTPSPVNQGHSQALPGSTNTLLTNTSPYSARNTMTSVTTITPFNKGHPNHVQAQTSIQQNLNGTMEFLQTVTNDLPNINGEVRVVKPDRVTNNSEAILDSTATRVVHPTKEVVDEFCEKPNKDNKSNAAISQGTLGLLNGRLAVLPNKFPPKPPESTKITEDFCHMQVNQTDGLDLAGVNTNLRRNSKAEEEQTSDHGGVKSILKRRGISKKPGGILKKAGSTGSINKNFEVRDSLEVAKQHLQQQQDGRLHQTPQKKSVRFADLCEDDDVDEMEDFPEHNEQRLFVRRNKEPLTVNVKPMRPMSAKPSSGSSKMESSGRPVKITSANLPRQASIQRPKSSIRPQAAAHIITRMSPENSTNHAQTDQMTERTVSIVNNNFMEKVPLMGQIVPSATSVTVYPVPAMNYVSTFPNTQPHIQNVALSTHPEISPSNVPYVPSSSNSVPSYTVVNGHPHRQAVYNENGLRIDRTPTDDEINMLWDKVRTCLDKNTPDVDEKSENFPEPARQTVSLSHKYIDGAALGPLNTINRVSRTQPVNSASSYLRKLGVPEQNNTYSRRYGLLQQRKQQQNPNELNKNVQMQRQNIMYHSPAASNGDPKQVPRQPAQEVSESLLAFTMAEKLCEQPLSDSHIHQEIASMNSNQEVNIDGRTIHKAPTALSMEERRLLESLDRLNEKLRLNEPTVPNSQQSPSQQHFVHAGGFKGHAPFLTHQRKPGTSSAHHTSVQGYGPQY